MTTPISRMCLVKEMQITGYPGYAHSGQPDKAVWLSQLGILAGYLKEKGNYLIRLFIHYQCTNLFKLLFLLFGKLIKRVHCRMQLI